MLGGKTRLCHHPPPSFSLGAPCKVPGNALTGILGKGILASALPSERQQEEAAGKKNKKRAVAILLIQSTSAVINKAHLSAPRCHGPPALFKSRFPCFAQPFHAAATPRSIPQNHQHPPKMMSVCVTPLHKAMGSHQDLLQHSPATKTSVLSPRRAGYPQQPSCSPGMSILAAKATTSLCFSLLHQTILRLGLLENTNSGTSR